MQTQLHASCVSIDQKGVLLMGASGSGKSDLALRLIHDGALLVADDRVDISIISSPLVGEGDAEHRVGGDTSTNHQPPTTNQDAPLLNPPPLNQRLGGRRLVASCPPSLQGLLEVRGIGILQLPHQANVPLGIAVDLVERGAVERLPQPAWFEHAGHRIPRYALHAFDASAVAKIHALLRYPQKPL